MNRTIRSERIKQLKQKGFKVIPGFSFLYINDFGKVFSIEKNDFIKLNAKNLIFVENRYINVPKMILKVFKEETLKNGHIVYKDENKVNLNVENLGYKRFYKDSEIVRVDSSKLVESIRCYFEVEKRFNPKDTIKTKLYLMSIANERGFFEVNKDKDRIEVFKCYLSGKNIKECSEKYRIEYRDCNFIQNLYKELLVSEVLNDKQQGLLSEKDFIKRKKSKKQAVKEWNDYNKNIQGTGIKK